MGFAAFAIRLNPAFIPINTRCYDLWLLSLGKSESRLDRIYRQDGVHTDGIISMRTRALYFRK